jgi:tetratricopeptide (TPR) repeat protein
MSFNDLILDENIPEEKITELIAEADTIIANEEADPVKRAEAYVIKFQCLERQKILAPKFLDKALDLYPEMPQALALRGVFFYNTGDRLKALECIDRAIETAPSCFAYLLRARWETELDKKILYYYEAIRINPDSITAFEECGDEISQFIFEKINNNNDAFISNIEMIKLTQYVQDAIAMFTNAISLNSSNYHNFEKRAELYLLGEKAHWLKVVEDNFTKVISDIQSLVLLYPSHNISNCITIVHNMFANMPHDRRIKYLSRMIQDITPDTNAYWIVNTLLAEENGQKNALQIYTAMIETNKEGSFWQLYGYYYRSRIYRDNRNQSIQALDDLAMIVKFGSRHDIIDYRIPYEIDPINARKDRAEIYIDLKEYSNAINEYSEIIELVKSADNFNFLESHMSRACLYEETEEYDKALDDYSNIIDISKNMSSVSKSALKEVYLRRIKIYKNRGEMDKAFNDFIKMLEYEDNKNFISRYYKTYSFFDSDNSFSPDFEVAQYKILE